MAAQDCTRKMGDENCVFHPGEKLVFECINCSGELACIACVSSIHQTHKLVDIKESVLENIQKINSFFIRLKGEMLPEVVREIKFTTSKLQDIEQMCHDEIEKVKTQEKKLNELVIAYSATKISKLELLLKETIDILNRHKAQMETLQRNLEQNSMECQRSLKSGTDVLLHDTKTKMGKLLGNVTNPKIPELTTSSFVPCQDPKPHLERAFGELKDIKMTHRKIEYPCEQDDINPSVSSKYLNPQKTLYECGTFANGVPNDMCGKPDKDAWLLESVKARTVELLYDTQNKMKKLLENVTTPKIPELTTCSFSVSFEFLNPPKTLFELGTFADVLPNGMCGIPYKRVWLLESEKNGWFSQRKYMHLFDYNGNKHMKIQTNKDILSICSDPKTGNVYCTAVSSYVNSDIIRKVDTCTGETSAMSMIRLGIGKQTRHISIGCTNDNHLIVGMIGTVQKIHFLGQVVKTYNYTGITVPEISVCGKTNSIALIFSGWYLPVGRVAGGGTVIVLDQSLRKIYEYSGEGPQRVFQPSTAAFDGKYLLVGDRDNILVLEGGKLVHIIHTQKMSDVRALCVQEHGVLFVGCTTKMLRIKYLNTPVSFESHTATRFI